MDEEYFDVLVKYHCTIEITDQNGTVFQSNHDGQLELLMDQEEIEETGDSDFMSEILKSAMEQLSEEQYESEPFLNSKSLRFTIDDYEVVISQ